MLKKADIKKLRDAVKMASGSGLPEKDRKELLKVLSEEEKLYKTQEALPFKHCDDYIRDLSVPLCLRFFLLVHRLPAVDMALLHMQGIEPKLFADYKGSRVRVVMASRLGDVGITYKLDVENGYQSRVPLDQLSNFGSKP